ncbi:SPOR domain-containing protein [Sphingomonas mucosissima]|uniref:Beta-barrel assembly-enhancing protease n=1 Tax=Sphingomonas mucosissima TaxID=370959 RepID=A0A245ZST4_9SPHN|nr:SPOR domain-containing protein [Sphingomonas mucosissima]OWK32819.1 beta-barrel assembly-enhancing protease [Sphingomonas mucosissima]
MNKRALAGFSLSALMLGGAMVGCAQGGISTVSTRSEAALAKQAARNAQQATDALAKGDLTKAISFAEAAVEGEPRNANYRALLGSTYLKAGRFTSAHAAYADVLSLSPENGKAALNLALAMIAEGQWDEARASLEEHAAIVPASDRGLAVALAGDPGTGVELLTAAARSPNADAKTRQNLALVLALAGRWTESRQIAGIDMGPTEADARVLQWASFAKPVGAADQVSALLGVRPVKDPGQPVALALNTLSPASAMPAATLLADASVAAAGEASPAAMTAAGETSAPGTRIVFAERREVVQQLPRGSAPIRQAAVEAPQTRFAALDRESTGKSKGGGRWFVQLGAYDSAAVAKDAWERAQRRHPAFAGETPTGMAFKSFYRLSVGGYSRAEANELCRGYRSNGGACFVRTSAGDQTAAWAKAAKVQLAGR